MARKRTPHSCTRIVRVLHAKVSRLGSRYFGGIPTGRPNITSRGDFLEVNVDPNRYSMQRDYYNRTCVLHQVLIASYQIRYNAATTERTAQPIAGSRHDATATEGRGCYQILFGGGG